MREITVPLCLLLVVMQSTMVSVRTSMLWKNEEKLIQWWVTKWSGPKTCPTKRGVEGPGLL